MDNIAKRFTCHAILTVTLALADRVLPQHKGTNPGAAKWRSLAPKIERLLTRQGDPCRGDGMRADPTDGANSFGTSFALIDACPLGAYTELIVVMRLEEDETVLARSRKANHEVDIESVRGASVMHGRDVNLMPENQAVGVVSWDNEGLDKAGILKLQRCVVDAYVWNSNSKTLDWNSKLTKRTTRNYCQNLQHQVHQRRQNTRSAVSSGRSGQTGDQVGMNA
jgi:hypothetical protein